MREKVGKSVNIKKKMLKIIIGKLERKMIMRWTLTWLNWSVAIIKAMLQLLDI